MRGAARAERQAAAAGGAREPERERLRGAAHDDLRRDIGRDASSPSNSTGRSGSGSGAGKRDELKRLRRQGRGSSSRVWSSRIGRSWTSCGDQRAQACGRRQPAERPAAPSPASRTPRPRVASSSAVAAALSRTWTIGVRVVARRREEPRLDRAPVADALDPPGALSEPDIAKAASEQARAAQHAVARPRARPGAGRSGRRRRPRRRRCNAARAANSSSAGERRLRKSAPPRCQERGVRGTEREHDPARARPDAAIAASAFVTSSGMIWTRSTPPWAKFSRKYRPRTRPT